MKYFNFIVFIILLPVCAAMAADSFATEFEVKVSKIMMGTVVEATAHYHDVGYCKRSLVSAFREMERIENLLSYQKSGSEISKINSAAGKHAVRISSETFSILQRSLVYAKKYNGLFDITIGPVSDLWGFSSPEGGHLPLKKEIARRLAFVNYHDLILDEGDSTAYLEKESMLIDLGGIAKGYAIDRGSAILRGLGITNFILNAGGDIYVSGQKSENEQWKIGVKDPRNSQKLVARFEIKDKAVATSGDYERFIIIDGHRYHHIIDTRNGFPGMLSQSCTVFAATAEEADALATYLFIIGSKQALQNELTMPFLIIDADGQFIANDLFKNLPGLAF